MKKLFYLTLFTFLLFSCGEPQQEFTHTIIDTEGLVNAEIAYAQIKPDSNDVTEILVSKKVTNGDIVFQRVGEGIFTVFITDENGTTTFNEIPAKYLNLDATLEVTRNIFQDYFPEEWEAMRGGNFTSFYVKSKLDNQVFYLKTVFTGTDKEIGMYSEDF